MNKHLVIDADTHIAPKKEGGVSISGEELVAKMDRAGVDKTLTWVHPPYLKKNLDEYVSFVYEETKKYPDRICGLGWINPNLGMDNAVALTERCMNDYGFYGVKMNGSKDGYFIDDKDKTYPIIDVVAKKGGIIAFHSACDDYVHVHPNLVAKVAKDYPETTFLMIHMGGESFNDLSDAAIKAAKECSNIILVGSEILKPSLKKAINILGADRIAYGSDTPFEIMEVEVAAYMALFDEMNLSEEDRGKIMGGNIQKLLKL